ncbi:hypothetical protein ACF1GT_01820 [Streptomyces sp. NPDC014636]
MAAETYVRASGEVMAQAAEAAHLLGVHQTDLVRTVDTTAHG